MLAPIVYAPYFEVVIVVAVVNAQLFQLAVVALVVVAVAYFPYAEVFAVALAVADSPYYVLHDLGFVSAPLAVAVVLGYRAQYELDLPPHYGFPCLYSIVHHLPRFDLLKEPYSCCRPFRHPSLYSLYLD